MSAPGRRVIPRTSAPADTARREQSAEQLWTRPPQAPTRYSLRTRLADMAHGWVDGRRGLPSLPEIPPARSVNGAASQTPNGHFDVARLEPFQDRVAESDRPAAPAAAPATAPADRAAAMPPGWLQTPRMQVLCSRALELISAEEQACIRDCAAYKRELAEFRSTRDAVDEESLLARARLASTQRLPENAELAARRLAERDAHDRPDAFVRKRRRTEWERRVATASRDSQSVARRLAEATRDAELREELIQDRIAVARAAAHCHHEFHMRRIATYLQQLVRTHKRGDELNMLIMRYPVGPDLPDWTRAPTGARPSTGPSSRGAGGASAEQNGASEPHPTSEMSSP